MPRTSKPDLAPVTETEDDLGNIPLELDRRQPKLAPAPEPEEKLSIAKPGAFDLDRFKSKHAAAMAGVKTLLMALPVHSIAAAKDFVRLHPDEDNYWSDPLCFVNVPVKGQKKDTLSLVDEDLAMKYLRHVKIARHRLALATKPWDAFFLCQIPSENLDNTWNITNVAACQMAQSRWTTATSLDGVEGYQLGYSEDEKFVPEPDWPSESLAELIQVTFAGRMIDRVDHPSMVRLRGGKQSIK